MNKIICFHLYNDNSGSPIVLKMVLSGLIQKGYQIELITSSGGVLDILETKIRLHKYKYHFSNNPILTIIKYIWIQLYTFLFAFQYCFQKDVVFYINTLLPLGPALAGRIMGKKVVYHYHEDASVKGKFYQILAQWMQWIANDIICVSHYQSLYLTAKNKIKVIPNSLTPEFTERCCVDEKAQTNKTILMLSSLKEYKGTKEFIKLANDLQDYNFIIVINDTSSNIKQYLSTNHLIPSSNLEIIDRQTDVVPFYKRSSIVLNLSNKKLFVETFGMTILEAMTFGLPVIVPTIGGVAELVENGANGYKIDVQDLDKIKEKIKMVLSDEILYRKLSDNAKRISEKYSYQYMIDEIENILINKNCQ